jgi:HD-GYP domain-containing protein (c-di-GMP phosphodiesterase class II)
VFALEPGRFVVPLDEDYLDEIAIAFGQVVDSKSPYTAGHSARVALYTDRIAAELGLDPQRRRWLRRARCSTTWASWGQQRGARQAGQAR